ncbi:MAG: hypothetical protein NC489_08055 [Ruminococcus flavefaciens]|nr:hypothetical protein [Ruminococcus flavefaciens]
MSWYADLRVLTEAVDADTVLDILGRSNVESTVLLTKAAAVFGKELAKAKSTKDPDEQLKIWKQALKDAKAMQKMARSIPPDGVADHTWRLFTSPWWMNLYAYGKAAASPDEKVTEVTKDDTLKKFDMMIAYIEHEIEKLEKSKEE